MAIYKMTLSLKETSFCLVVSIEVTGEILVFDIRRLNYQAKHGSSRTDKDSKNSKN